ncbi:MAG: LptF/LptG family permease [Paludibacter sp.]|nr:LptF/LptG family permease [Paludibacter sp.]MDD4199601.1 LptF/LptG family permease [Paludibacter sp.]MDD4429626.1 LptF/LptG family permease [Paludibacter sp.]
MSVIKKIDSYILKRFFTLFVMTFLIVIFILLMQFLWKHFADLVGKGIGWDVLAEFFIYAVMTLVPLALPLALLLASLMTFGNLGENFELTAMKSAGISLFRIIRPLMIFVAFIVVGAFFFSNYVLPKSQKNMYTLLFSIRHKSPELDVPVGEFYAGINGVNLYVRDKDKSLLKDLMIYDFSSGFSNAAVLVADSGKIQLTGDKKYLLLTLYHGESFENLREQKMSGANNIPYRRETFSYKELLYDFDSEFNRYDESLLQDQHISKNIRELSHSIDSIKKIIEVRSASQVQEMLQYRYFLGNVGEEISWGVDPEVDLTRYDPDSAFLNLGNSEMEFAVNYAVERAKSMLDHIQYNKLLLGEPQMYMNRHASEWHRKFALSFACLIFFFIGAPLGAIIRKGGFGFPVVISVLMFVIYYIIDLTGYKMAREGIWEAYQGMWLSSAILFPVGVFLTYKAAVDATLFNPEIYVKFFHTIKIKIYHFIRISVDDEYEDSK